MFLFPFPARSRPHAAAEAAERPAQKMPRAEGRTLAAGPVGQGHRGAPAQKMLRAEGRTLAAGPVGQGHRGAACTQRTRAAGQTVRSGSPTSGWISSQRTRAAGQAVRRRPIAEKEERRCGRASIFKEKSEQALYRLLRCGGSGGIRTHGPFYRITRFRVEAVMTTSIRFHQTLRGIFHHNAK